jgi:hypothetical protein
MSRHGTASSSETLTESKNRPKSRQGTSSPTTSRWPSGAQLTLEPDVVKLSNDMELLNFANGDEFIGAKQSDGYAPSGQGTYKLRSTGHTYTGTFQDNRLVGEATVKTRKGDLTSATWRLDSSAEGTIRFANGDVYFGKLSSNKPHGYGVMEYTESRARYEGQWENASLHGEGQVTFPNGDFVNGTWSHGRCLDAQGRRHALLKRPRFLHNCVLGANEATREEAGNGIEGSERTAAEGGRTLDLVQGIYTGSMAVAVREGPGLEEVANAGNVNQECEGVQDELWSCVFVGEGRCEFEDGSRYNGEWQNSRPHGRGLLLLANLLRFDGSFVHGAHHPHLRVTSALSGDNSTDQYLRDDDVYWH